MSRSRRSKAAGLLRLFLPVFCCVAAGPALSAALAAPLASPQVKLTIRTQMGPVIRIKVSAQKQAPEIRLKFAKRTYGLGAPFTFYIYLMKAPEVKVTNISVTENFDYDVRSRRITDYRPIDSGIPELTVYQVSSDLLEPGLYEYRVQVSGRDYEGLPFNRSGSEQIIVETNIDEGLKAEAEVGPFVYDSDSGIVWGEEHRDLQTAVTRLRLGQKFKALERLKYDYRVEVTGYADKSLRTNESHNLVLSSNRARNVADMLMKVYGLSPENFIVTGAGSAGEAYADAPGAPVNRNRRVIVRIR